jgi:hypothetical protein
MRPPSLPSRRSLVDGRPKHRLVSPPCAISSHSPFFFPLPTTDPTADPLFFSLFRHLPVVAQALTITYFTFTPKKPTGTVESPSCAVDLRDDLGHAKLCLFPVLLGYGVKAIT